VPPVPHYDLWLGRVRDRPPPPRAATLLPQLRAAFAAEGVPTELVWLAEAESSFNPTARSPVGAKGLFQFMPETAKAHGLSTFLPDERTEPVKSARAAARYLRQLHGRFGNWALALAAYNAGEGRVARTLAARRASSFTAIADALPAETRMYVPKVCALIATRAGMSPHQIPPPRK
jgi:membrane-bound lytic murein transglycosylase D